jgi:hypothetical protein
MTSNIVLSVGRLAGSILTPSGPGFKGGADGNGCGRQISYPLQSSSSPFEKGSQRGIEDRLIGWLAG